MSIQTLWVGDEGIKRVALTRMLCYAAGERELPRFAERLRGDPRASVGDYLLAISSGRDVGTATAMSLNMWVRGSRIPCQGVAWVGAIKTMRRRGGKPSRGIASLVMNEVIHRGRERGDVVSALMPFRASFYEHFGYGLVERRNDWLIPISILPVGDFEGLRFYEPADFAARAECLRHKNKRGQCDIERSDAFWKAMMPIAEEGMQIIDRPAEDGPARGSMFISQQQENGKDVLRVTELIFEELAALRRQLHFLASLRDQYFAVRLTLGAQVRLNWLLRETQLPHRLVNHAIAEAKPVTRMQLRILDHQKFLEALHLPAYAAGSLTVAVRESEGHQSRFRVEMDAGRAVVTPSESAADFECPDRVWATVACGDMTAGEAMRLGLAEGNERADVLDALASGDAPFCHEYF